jgi:hypothetical protein
MISNYKINIMIITSDIIFSSLFNENPNNDEKRAPISDGGPGGATGGADRLRLRRLWQPFRMSRGSTKLKGTDARAQRARRR